MKTTSWRIVKKKFAARAFDGEGARVHGGRWNSAGVPAIYTAGSVSLAILEMLVHGAEPLVSKYCVIPVTFDGALLEELDPRSLPAGWDRYPAPPSTMAAGDAWLRSKRSAVLRVPSAVVASESNYLLNPKHPHFGRVAIGAPDDLPLDPRLAR